eukprot:TRINITY_DN14680_c2_g1_i1.p1 TRINITY_DN14680_c2_g1~~TRINITY_DN14680_c2_g1_i1.p1  ORF type:complete len:178 (-),score=7.81 TRINITY_DN14680_c2_g1_i1:267-800(-)
MQSQTKFLSGSRCRGGKCAAVEAPLPLPPQARDVFADMHEQLDELQPPLSKSVDFEIGEVRLRLDPSVSPLRFAVATSPWATCDARILFPDVDAFMRVVERVRDANTSSVLRLILWGNRDVRIKGRRALAKLFYEGWKAGRKTTESCYETNAFPHAESCHETNNVSRRSMRWCCVSP